MVLLVGDRNRSVAALMAVKMWKDPVYRARVLEDPKAVLEEEGIFVPDDATVVVKESTADVTYVPLAPDAHVDPDPDAVLALFRRLLPIHEGHELRLVQSTEQTRYLVIPERPTGVDPAELTDAELMRAVGSVEEVQTQTADLGIAVEETENAAAETLQAVVTETELTAT